MNPQALTALFILVPFAVFCLYTAWHCYRILTK